MDNPKILDKRKVRLEQIMRDGFIPFLEGRPRRDSIINRDDLVNLRINLNVTKSIDDFLKMI